MNSEVCVYSLLWKFVFICLYTAHNNIVFSIILQTVQEETESSDPNPKERVNH